MGQNLNSTIISKNSAVATEFFKAFYAVKSKKTQYPGGTVGFIPFNIEFTVDGISGIKIYDKLEIDTSFLPKSYPDSLDFIVTGIDHSLKDGDWETTIKTTLIPKFENFEEAITAEDSRIIAYKLPPTSPSATLPVFGSFNIGTDFRSVTLAVIQHLEGGYWSEEWFKNPSLGAQMGWKYDSRYASSGETMFGLDRKAGAGLFNGSHPAGVEFWKLIDNANNPPKSQWRWGYTGAGSSMPYYGLTKPGSVSTTDKALFDRLRELVVDLQENHPYAGYKYLLNKYFGKNPQLKDIIENDGRLKFHFSYGVWNGEGWFKKFANDLNEAWNDGITDPNQLVIVAIQSRKFEGLTNGTKPNSLIKQGGTKMEELFKVKIPTVLIKYGHLKPRTSVQISPPVISFTPP